MDKATKEFMSRVYKMPIIPAPIEPKHRQCSHGDKGCDGDCEPARCVEFHLWWCEPDLYLCYRCQQILFMDALNKVD